MDNYFLNVLIIRNKSIQQKLNRLYLIRKEILFYSNFILDLNLLPWPDRHEQNITDEKMYLKDINKNTTCNVRKPY